MQLVTKVIPCPDRNGSELLLMPVGDIQYAGPGSSTALGMLQRHIAWGVERGAYFLGMGDYVDFASPSNRLRIAQAGLYDTATDVMDDKALELVLDLYEKALKPSRGRWLGMLEGHHWWQFKTGTTTDQRLCEMLDAPFLGTCAFVRLVFQATSTRMGTVTIWCHHGAGYGQRVSAPLNRLDQLLINWDADIYLMGHQSKKVSAPIDRISAVWDQRNPHTIHRTKIIACTGSFSRAYIPGHREGHVPRGTYVEQKMLAPTSLGGVLIRIRPRWANPNGPGAPSPRGPGKDSRIWLPDLSVEA